MISSQINENAYINSGTPCDDLLMVKMEMMDQLGDKLRNPDALLAITMGSKNGVPKKVSLSMFGFHIFCACRAQRPALSFFFFVLTRGKESRSGRRFEWASLALAL